MRAAARSAAEVPPPAKKDRNPAGFATAGVKGAMPEFTGMGKSQSRRRCRIGPQMLGWQGVAIGGIYAFSRAGFAARSGSGAADDVIVRTAKQCDTTIIRDGSCSGWIRSDEVADYDVSAGCVPFHNDAITSVIGDDVRHISGQATDGIVGRPSTRCKTISREANAIIYIGLSSGRSPRRGCTDMTAFHFVAARQKIGATT